MTLVPIRRSRTVSAELQLRLNELRARIVGAGEDEPLDILHLLPSEFADVLKAGAEEGHCARRSDSIHVAFDGIKDWDSVRWRFGTFEPPRPWGLEVFAGGTLVWSARYDDADAFIWDLVTVVSIATLAGAACRGRESTP